MAASLASWMNGAHMLVGANLIDSSEFEAAKCYMEKWNREGVSFYSTKCLDLNSRLLPSQMLSSGQQFPLRCLHSFANSNLLLPWSLSLTPELHILIP